MLKRFASLLMIGIGLAVLLLASDARSNEDEPIVVTGRPTPDLAAIDQTIVNIMRQHKLPGGALAVAKGGRLVMAHGYGLADVEKNQPVRPDSLFRIASLSKPVTAAVFLRLVESGRLHLDDKALDFLTNIEPPPGKTLDPRWRQITIRQLLHHTAGFDSQKSIDPMCDSRKVASALGIPSPPDQKTIIRFMLGRPLDFNPGEKYAYSNFGYCVLGRIIEKVTGKSYEDAAKTLVLAPVGIRRMCLGHTRLEGRVAGEVYYYASPRTRLSRSVFAIDDKDVPSPYGTFYIEAMDSHGGWVASAIDLIRFWLSWNISRAVLSLIFLD